MPTYEVFHAHDLFAAYQRTLTHPGSPVEREHYQKVADVEAQDLEEVFCLTNTTLHPWWTNQAVTPVPGAVPTRSTSVGDLIALGTHLFFVEPSGFTPVRWSLHCEPGSEAQESDE
jgi:hypothetical protein